MDGQIHGYITRLVRDRGFGFLRRFDRPFDYYFHRSALQRGAVFENLREHQAVTFAEGDGVKGPRAERVRVVQHPKDAGAVSGDGRRRRHARRSAVRQ